MRDRKKDLLRAQACIVLPGGFGTLDELSEILALKQAGVGGPHVILLNLRNYFDYLIEWFVERMIPEGFLRSRHMDVFEVVASPQEAVRAVKKMVQ
jgi:uncharacterized protein (TIGR00730 family)